MYVVLQYPSPGCSVGRGVGRGVGHAAVPGTEEHAEAWLHREPCAAGGPAGCRIAVWPGLIA